MAQRLLIVSSTESLAALGAAPYQQDVPLDRLARLLPKAAFVQCDPRFLEDVPLVSFLAESLCWSREHAMGVFGTPFDGIVRRDDWVLYVRTGAKRLVCTLYAAHEQDFAPRESTNIRVNPTLVRMRLALIEGLAWLNQQFNSASATFSSAMMGARTGRRAEFFGEHTMHRYIVLEGGEVCLHRHSASRHVFDLAQQLGFMTIDNP